MIFQHTIDKVLSGKKTETSRLIQPNESAVYYNGRIDSVLAHSRGYPHGRVKYSVGKTYAIQPGRGKKAVGRFRLIAIRQADRRYISPTEIKHEGFDSLYDFLQIWCQMHDLEALPLLESLKENPTVLPVELARRPDERYRAWVLTLKIL